MQEENKVKRSFFQNLKAELKKVIWPTGKQVVKNTFATIAFVLIISLALIVFNLVFEFAKTKLWYEPIFGTKKEDKSAVSSGDTITLEELENLISGEISGEPTEEVVPSEETPVAQTSEDNTVTE